MKRWKKKVEERNLVMSLRRLDDLSWVCFLIHKDLEGVETMFRPRVGYGREYFRDDAIRKAIDDYDSKPVDLNLIYDPRARRAEIARRMAAG